MNQTPSLRIQAKKTLSLFADILDSALENDRVEIDANDDSLTLEFPCKSQILLTYHGVANQLWLSCPQSGAHHFNYMDDQWICTRTSRPLTTILSRDISHYVNRPFQI